MSGDEKRDTFGLLPPVPATVTSILALAQRREGAAHDEAASLRATIARQVALLEDAAADARAYERRIGSLSADLWRQSQLARQARRDQWITLLMAAIGIVVVVGLAALAILAGA